MEMSTSTGTRQPPSANKQRRFAHQGVTVGHIQDPEPTAMTPRIRRLAYLVVYTSVLLLPGCVVFTCGV